uniref:Uncharacterized protein n=1 Tax=Meloidogyne floridensis TaxID=298350 RepID=A0A915PFR8_9BILA
MLIKKFFGIFILFLLFLNLTEIVDGVEIKLLEEEIESSKIPEESGLTNFKVGEIDVPVNIEKNKNIQEKLIEEEKQSQKPNPGKASSMENKENPLSLLSNSQKIMDYASSSVTKQSEIPQYYKVNGMLVDRKALHDNALKRAKDISKTTKPGTKPGTGFFSPRTSRSFIAGSPTNQFLPSPTHPMTGNTTGNQQNINTTHVAPSQPLTLSGGYQNTSTSLYGLQHQHPSNQKPLNPNATSYTPQSKLNVNSQNPPTYGSFTEFYNNQISHQPSFISHNQPINHFAVQPFYQPQDSNIHHMLNSEFQYHPYAATHPTNVAVLAPPQGYVVTNEHPPINLPNDPFEFSQRGINGKK